MAEEQESNEENIAEEGKKGNLKNIILMVVAALLIAAISVTATLFLMPKPETKSEEDLAAEEMLQDGQAGTGTEMTISQAIYLPMRPAFIANFQDGARQRFLQFEISLLARDQESIDVAKKHEPLLRNNIIAVISAQTFSQLKTDEGKLAFNESLTVAVQEILLEEIGRPGIEKILFTSFVLQ